MAKYILNAVYQAAAVDEIYCMLRDELELSKEDLKEIEQCFYDLGKGEVTFSEINIPNLNLTAVQDKLSDRILVLREKVCLLHSLMCRIVDNTNYNIIFGCGTASNIQLDDDEPF